MRPTTVARCSFLDVSDTEIGRPDLIREVIANVREQVGPVASFKYVIVVPRLPKTRSGKIARNTLAAIAAGQPYKVVSQSRFAAKTGLFTANELN